MSNTTPIFNLINEPKASDNETFFNYCKCGPTNIPENISEPADVFLLFWAPIWEDVVSAINLEITENLQRSGRARKEKLVVTSDILLAWLGCWIQLGLHPQHSIRDAFSREEGDPFIKKFFVRDDFRDIFSAMWHLKDEIINLIEIRLNEAFPHFWTAFREASIDEGMAAFKGHWHNKVYSPDKPIRFGLKYYLLVDAAQYLLQFKLYRSETRTTMEELIYKFVDVLPKDNGQYAIYGDNYYGGLDVAKGLNEKGFKFTFTCRSNRPTNLFKNFLHEKMEDDASLGNVAFAVSDDDQIGACSWQDNSLVNFISNIHFNDVVEVDRRKNRKIIKKKIPRVAQDYTQIGMGHVDAFDSYVERYRAHHKNVSWRRAHFLQLIQYSMVNSYHIFRMVTKKKTLSYKNFLNLMRNSLVKRREQFFENEKLQKKESRKNQNRIAKRKSRSKQENSKTVAAALGLIALAKRRHERVNFLTSGTEPDRVKELPPYKRSRWKKKAKKFKIEKGEGLSFPNGFALYQLCRSKDKMNNKDETSEWKIHVPPDMVQKILCHFHPTDNTETGIGSHMGVRKTYEQIANLHTGITYEDVINHKNHCDTCVDNTRIASPVLDVVPIISNYVNERWVIDTTYMQEYKDDNDGYEYIGVIVDHFSKKAWAFPMRTRSAEEWAWIIVPLIYEYDAPRMLHSDNGGEFVNKILEAIAKAFSIKLVNGGPYQPQQQGIVEKLNDTIKDSLSKKMQQYGTRKWIPYLNQVLSSYNMAPHTVTKIPPFVLFYNRPVLVLNSTKNPEPVELKEFTPEEYKQMAEVKLKQVDELGDVVYERLVSNGKSMSKKRNKKNKKKPKFEIGVAVAIHFSRFVKKTQISKLPKLKVADKRFPCRGVIDDINHNGHYIIKLDSGEILDQPVRARYLKRIDPNEHSLSSNATTYYYL